MPRSVGMWILLLAVAILGGCKGNTQATPPTSKEFETAKDPNVYWADRITAARRLNETERAQLQALLLSQIPGSMNAAATEAAGVLGAIGDEEAAKRLEIVTEMPTGENGKFRIAVEHFLADIRARTGTATHSAETKPE
jgi:hypothetical protein